MVITFENKSPADRLIEKITSIINATNDCNNSKDKTHLNQDLKNQLVEEFIKVIIAKGVIKTKTFSITYLKEYVKSKFNKLNEIKPFNNPSSEKIFKVFSVDTILFIFRINSEKLILQLNRFSPTSLIAREIIELMFKNCSIKKYEKFDNIAYKNNLKIN